MKSVRTIDEHGYIEWRLPNGQYHREDGPAFEDIDGNKYWFLNGFYHREDGPAIEMSDGRKYWYLNGGLHRTDGPAVEWPNGSKAWWLNGTQLDPKTCIKSNDGKYPELIKAMIVYEIMD